MKGDELSATKNISFTKEMVGIPTMAESSQNLIGYWDLPSLGHVANFQDREILKDVITRPEKFSNTGSPGLQADSSLSEPPGKPSFKHCYPSNDGTVPGL